MNKRVLLSLSVVFLVVLGFGILRFNSIKDNKLYTIKENQSAENTPALTSEIKGEVENKFYDAGEYRNKLGKNAIFVTVSKDKNHLFYMVPSISKGKNRVKVIKGRTGMEMNLIDWNLSEGSKMAIAYDTFITSVSWNPAGDNAAFGGTNKMFTYSLNKKLSGGGIPDRTMDTLFWSPDGKAINVFNAHYPIDGIIFSPDTQSTGPIAEESSSKADPAFMGKINDNTFFAAVSDTTSDNSPTGSYKTVIVDGNGNILSDLCPGFYKDSFGKSVLIRNMDRTLSFIKDFNLVKTPSRLTREPVYDSGFVFDGGFYFITEDTSSTNNGFILHRMDSNKKETGTWKISGSSLLLSPEGTKGYVNGEKLEVIDFKAGTVTSTYDAAENDDMLVSALNLAAKNIKRSLLSGESLSSAGLPAEIGTDINKYLNKNLKGVPASYKLLLLSLNPEERVIMTNLSSTDENHAEATVNLTVQSYKLPVFSDIYHISLLKQDGQWKITNIKN